MSAKLKFPLSFDCAERLICVSMLVTVTLAFETTAPEESVTVPRIVELTAWPNPAQVARTNAKASNQGVLDRKMLFMCFLLPQNDSCEPATTHFPTKTG